MKTYLFLISGLFFLHKADAQINEFAPIGAKWWYSVQDEFPVIKQLSLEVIGDTIIEYHTCKVLRFDPVPNLTNNDRDIYLYQEDDIIYQYFESENNFLKLYDFSLAPGEGYWCHAVDFSNIVDSFYVDIISVEIIIVNGIELKKQTIHIDGYFDWFGDNIEIIGNNQMIIPVYGLLDAIQGPLRCFEDSVLGLYETGETAECDAILTGINELNENNINVFPNPFSNNITIHFNNPGIAQYNAKILSMVGETVSIFEIPAVEKYFVELNYLPSGNYFLHLQNSSSVIYQSIIKN